MVTNPAEGGATVPAAVRPSAAVTGPGLDRARLAALRRPHPHLLDLPDRIRDHLDDHDGYVAFSGGKDSTVVLLLALQVDPNVPVVFFDSGLEFPETYQYLRQMQDLLDLQLHWLHAEHSTLDLLAASGLWDHQAPRRQVPDLHQVLITEPAGRAHAAHGPGELWGVRARESRGRRLLYETALRRESARRVGSAPLPASGAAAGGVGAAEGGVDASELRRRHGGVVRRQDGTVAFGPVWDWSTEDVWSYLARSGLPVNPVYDKLRRLGAPEHLQRVSHMLDGSRLEEGRVTFLRRGWPALYEDLARVLPRLREYV